MASYANDFLLQNILAQAGVDPLGEQAGMPTGVPPAPPPGFGQQLAQGLSSPLGILGMNLLAASGPSLQPQSFAENIGRAGLATQANLNAQQKMELDRRLIESRIGVNKAAALNAQRDPMAGKRRVQSTQPLANGNIGYVDAFTGDVVDTGVQAGNRTQMVDIPGKGRHIFDPVQKTLIPIADEATIQQGEYGRKVAQTEGAQDPQARQTLPRSLTAIDQKIKRADEFITKLESGELDTGPAQQYISRFTPTGQDFQSFVGENVLDLISSATFGQLSEGERQFLTTISFGLAKDEKVNIRDLQRFKQILQKVKEIEQSELSRIQGGNEFEGFSIATD